MTMTRTAHPDQQVFLSDIQVGTRYGVSRQTPWGWLKKDSSFPKPVKLSPGCTRWRLSELEAWETAQNEQQK
ncbi:MAG: prophage regulatory protein [Limisphaerales bacterium]|jgi:prophage regulatory protein